MEELVLGVVEVLVGLCPLVELVGDVVTPHGLRHPGHTPVVVGIFQGLGGRLAFEVDGDEAIVPIGTHATTVLTGGVGHGFEGLLGVKAADAREIGIGNHRNGMVADHAMGFVAGQLPNGKHVFGIGLVIINKGIDEIDGAFPLDEAEERM